MTSTPIRTARPSVVSLAPSKAGNGKAPVKSILREPSARAPAPTRGLLKRKLDDRATSSDEEYIEDSYDEGNDGTDAVKDEDEDEVGDGDGDDASSGPRKQAADGAPQAKRQKTVHFDMNLNIATEVGRQTLHETKRSVRRALENHDIAARRPGHDDQDYIELVDVFSHDTEPYRDPLDDSGSGDEAGGGGGDGTEESGNMVRPNDLVLYVVALTSCTPLLKKSCVGLVRAVLATSWVGRDDRFFRAYVQFLAALVSAQGAFMRPVLEMIIDRFKQPRAASWAVPDFPAVSRETAQMRLHFGLRHMLRLFPAAKGVVCSLVGQKFPFPVDSKSVHIYYVNNLLRLREYAPALGADVLETITAQLVKIDTEFQLDLSDMDDDLVARVVFELATKESEKKGKAHNGLSREEGDDDGNDNDKNDVADDPEDADDSDSEADEMDAPQPGDPDYDEEMTRVDRSTKLVQKLDAILDRMFALYTPLFENPESATARRCLEDMLSDFANFVLTVPSSRHTQFLVFHFSQKSLELQDLFTGTLLNLGFESNRPAAVRQSAAAYLSSYMARGARVPRETVRTVAGILCQRIETFRRRHIDGCRGPDLRRYQELYSWVQALLYIFCFRWRDLVDAYPEDLVDPEDPASFVGKELEWMPGLKAALSNIIYAAFNPLIVCSPPIVAEFAKLAHSLRLMYVFPRIESNKSIHLAQYASGRYARGDALREDAGYAIDDDRWLQLEGHFPFDPYNLPISKRWLEGDYVAWTPIPGVDGGGDAAGDSDSDDSEANGYDDGEEEEDEDEDNEY